jgi:hypothetical protein
LICIEWCVAAGHLICGNILGTMLEPAHGGDSAAWRPTGKNLHRIKVGARNILFCAALLPSLEA